MGGASAWQLQSRCKMYSCFCKSTKMYIQLRVPTYNHNYFVLHCCLPPLAMTSLLEQAPASWLVNAPWISAKVQIFQLVRMTRQTLNSRYSCHSRRRIVDHCIDLTCKSFARNASFASCVNAPKGSVLNHNAALSTEFTGSRCYSAFPWAPLSVREWIYIESYLHSACVRFLSGQKTGQMFYLNIYNRYLNMLLNCCQSNCLLKSEHHW